MWPSILADKFVVSRTRMRPMAETRLNTPQQLKTVSCEVPYRKGVTTTQLCHNKYSTGV